MSQVIVYKFGGTSLDGANHIERALQIAGEALQRDSGVVLVASAVGATTDTLQELAVATPNKGTSADAVVTDLIERHRALARKLLSGSALAGCLTAIDTLGAELEEQVAAARSALPALPQRVATILSTGERLSTQLIAAAARQKGLPTS